MTEKDFMNRVANNKEDFLQVFLDLLAKSGASFCAIGGLAVNAYALQGKIWAALDEGRRASKRQKDLADILRLAETDKRLASLIPDSLKKKFL